MKCYTILYSKEGYFLTFTKGMKGYFFQYLNNGKGGINPKGVAIKNGPGLFAFPGGALEKDEEPYKGCLREFTEECGKEISFGYAFPTEESLVTLCDFMIDDYAYDILDATLHTVDLDYHALYLEFDKADLDQIEAIILNTNFEDAINASAEIIDGNFGSYDGIFNKWPFCPLDNELADIQLWEVAQDIDEIRQLKSNKQTDWYYDMIVYLANTMLDRDIQY